MKYSAPDRGVIISALERQLNIDVYLAIQIIEELGLSERIETHWLKQGLHELDLDKEGLIYSKWEIALACSKLNMTVTPSRLDALKGLKLSEIAERGATIREIVNRQP